MLAEREVKDLIKAHVDEIKTYGELRALCKNFYTITSDRDIRYLWARFEKYRKEQNKAGAQLRLFN